MVSLSRGFHLLLEAVATGLVPAAVGPVGLDVRAALEDGTEAIAPLAHSLILEHLTRAGIAQIFGSKIDA